MSNLFGRAKDVCRAVRDEVLTTVDCVQLVLDAIYKRDPLSVVAHILDELQKLLSTRGAKSEPFQSYGLRFNAQLCRIKLLGDSVQLSETMNAFYLLANANAESSQRLFIFAATAPNDMMLSPRLSMNDFVWAVKHKTVATVLQQCDDRLLDRASLHSAVSEAAPAAARNGLSK